MDNSKGNMSCFEYIYYSIVNQYFSNLYIDCGYDYAWSDVSYGSMKK